MAVVLAASMAAGCGSDETVEPRRDTGPFRASLDSAVAAIRDAGIPVTVRDRPAALASFSRPRVARSASFRSARGTVFDLLVYPSAKEALRAGPSIRQELDAAASITFSHNVLLVQRERRGDSLEIRRSVLMIGADGSAPG